MKKHAKQLIKKFTVALVALSMVLGAGAAQAADQTLGDAELKAAYAASNIRAAKTGFVATTPPLILGLQSKTIYSPVGNNVPANLAIAMKVFGINSASLMNISQSNPLSPFGNSSPITSAGMLESWQEYLDPEAQELAIGETSPNGFVLEKYEVTRPAAGKIAVHFEGRSETQIDEDGNYYAEQSDVVFTLDAGLITSAEMTSSADDYVDEGLTTYEYDVPEIQREFDNAVNAWKTSHFELSSIGTVDRLIKAFKTSQAAALKTGLTMKSTGKALPGFALYEPKLKKSVLVEGPTGKPVNGLGFVGATDTFADAFAVALGIDVFTGPGAVKFVSKTNTYTLKGATGQTSTIKVNSLGRVTSVSSILFGGPSIDYTFSYAADKTLWAKWGTMGPTTARLAQWIISAKDELVTAKPVFTKTSTGVKATGPKGKSITFKTTGMKATAVAALFKQLGYVLK